jgi:hypothetical protein
VTGSQAVEAIPRTINAGRSLALEARQFCQRTKQTQNVAIADATNSLYYPQFDRKSGGPSRPAFKSRPHGASEGVVKPLVEVDRQKEIEAFKRRVQAYPAQS